MMNQPHAQTRQHLIKQREAQIATLRKLARELKKQIVECKKLTERRNLAVLGGEATLADAILAYEAALISKALQIANGSVTHAAKTLGTSYQQLSFILEGRQKAIAHLRTPAHRRKCARPPHLLDCADNCTNPGWKVVGTLDEDSQREFDQARKQANLHAIAWEEWRLKKLIDLLGEDQ